jgi:Cu-Zn family superoxide dismutase
MPKPAGHRNAAAATMSALSLSFLATSVALVSACSSPQHASSVPGTTPAIWTGSPAPAGASGAEGVQPLTPSLSTHLRTPDGIQVATAKFDFSNGYATVTIATSGEGLLAPGFHGVHIHKVGKCEPNSVGPNGDLSVLQVRRDGVGMLVTTTDAFTLNDLTTGEKTAIIIHAGADNMPNGGMASSDQMPMSTGDAGKRVACGVIGAG